MKGVRNCLFQCARLSTARLRGSSLLHSSSILALLHCTLTGSHKTHTWLHMARLHASKAQAALCRAPGPASTESNSGSSSEWLRLEGWCLGAFKGDHSPPSHLSAGQRRPDCAKQPAGHHNRKSWLWIVRRLRKCISRRAPELLHVPQCAHSTSTMVRIPLSIPAPLCYTPKQHPEVLTAAVLLTSSVQRLGRQPCSLELTQQLLVRHQ